MSFYLLVEGKADPSWGKKLEIMDLAEEVEELQTDMKERISEIKRQINQSKRMQWMRRSSMSKDIMRNESLKCK